jgi:hypothetical protein
VLSAATGSKGVIVDIMPTGENVLGFKNKWYPEGYKNSIVVDIDGQYSIRIFSLPYFMASKLDAFMDRGNNIQELEAFVKGK